MSHFRLTFVGLLLWICSSGFPSAQTQPVAPVRPVEDVYHGTTVSDQGEMIGIVDAFIAGLATPRRPPRDIDAALRLLRDDPSVGVERLAASCALSLRQMERSCRERTGLGPKSFARLSRFDRAFHGKLQRPGLDWLSIAVACGYYDYQHMARDFRQFTGLSSSRLLETQSTSPEEILGVRHEFDPSHSVPMI